MEPLTMTLLKWQEPSHRKLQAAARGASSALAAFDSSETAQPQRQRDGALAHLHRPIR